ncbi:hypothetical protein DEJ39_07630 [Bacteroidetes bacterium SCGC AAA795-G10]|nr:hypothetical protein DEJ39_07630 [Bacteroidetes bacterium SCGC AAA795-G10]
MKNLANGMFPNLTQEVEKELSFILGTVSHHIHPDIVKYLVEANISLKEDFGQYSHEKLNIHEFFFDNSDCVFPGVRRPVNKETSGSKWKNNIYKDGTILNDNTYPRHIWSFLVNGKPYSSSNWKITGLNAFELAHIFGHKTDETGLEKMSFLNFEENKNPYSLFTSASNVVLIPKGLTKPTDKNNSIKLCYYQRHLDLFGENFFHMSGFKKELVPSWYKDIKWLDPILPLDWKKNIDLLIDYRERHLKLKYGGSPNTKIQFISKKDEKQKNIFSTSGDGEHSATRFFVNEKIYQKLIDCSNSNFILKVTPNKGKHPKGIYIIPNKVIVRYIEKKRSAYNWQQNKTYHQDGIPKDLRDYFSFR